ncbi:restriction endonuclease subunit S [Quatrionicoccus australiensis]|uniref:restriction endonuclease subunit S n=1 Tax=Quatrionicoccus australiensis TaxID=138118 RepID=UPI001CFBB351|nr:restriction endonuclease subunit S [Quatrionicoccus australiensis]
MLSVHLPLLASAPNGIQKLRGLILELAVRGKLVPQDPNDEPASELLRLVAKERARLEVEGVCKKSKCVPPASADEQPFTLRDGWKWARLDSVAPLPIADGDWIESKDQDVNGNVRLVQLADVGVGEFKNKSARFVNDETFSRLNCTEIVPGDILVARLPNPIGRACIFPGLDQKAITVVDVAILRPMKGTCSDYFVLAINAKPFREQVESYGKGATRFRVSTGHLKTIALPIPPLAEQHRIVAKVDELMTLCDRLEAEQMDTATAHARLVETLLGTLTQSTDATDLAANWQRLAGHFDALFTTEASIGALKQTVLQLAVMGKLVPQDSNDEPANELLKQIADERARLETDGICKKSKLMPPIGEDEQPFDVPESWAWERIGNYAIQTDYGLSEKTFPATEGVPVLKMGDIQAGNVILGGQKAIPVTTEGLPYLFLERYDLLYNRTNSAELVGKTGIFRGPAQQYSFASYLIRIRCANGLVSPCFLNFVMNSPMFRETEIVPHLKQQCGQANVNGTILRNMRIPVPPAAEQHRIVAKVDEMMALCDNLKADLASARQHQAKLSDTLIESALEAA